MQEVQPDPAVQALMQQLGLPHFLLPIALLSQTGNRVVLTARVGAHPSLRVSVCVVKVMIPPFSDAEENGFSGEYLHLDALRHQNWVRPLLFGRLQRRGYYLALQQEPGVVLSKLGRMAWSPATLGICHGILSGLTALHLTKHAHLDLNPEQVLVQERSHPDGFEEQLGSYKVALLDLGLSAPFMAAFPPRGTPGFIAPELFTETWLPTWDGRADLYSFGGILHQLVMGKPAFPGADSREVLRNQLRGFDPARLHRDKTLPEGLRLLIMDLLETDPELRPADAGEVWQRLRDLLPPSDVTKVADELTRADAPPFLGRSNECDAFADWIAESQEKHRECIVEGEPGMGRTRLLARLRTIAFTRDWFAIEDPSDDGSCLLGADANRTLRLVDRATPILHTRLSSSRDYDVVRSSNELRLILSPPAEETMLLMAESLGIQSKPLAAEVVRLSLGNPALLYGVVDHVRSDPLVGEEVSRWDIDELGGEEPPSSWTAWVGQLLQELPVVAQRRLLTEAMLPSLTPPEFAEAALAGSELFSTLESEILNARGLLQGSGAVLSRLWARAMHVAGAEVGRSLIGRFEDCLATNPHGLPINAAEELTRTSLRLAAPSPIYFLFAWNAQVREGLLERSVILAIDFLAVEAALQRQLLSTDERSQILRKTLVAGNMVCPLAARRMPLERVPKEPLFSVASDLWTLFRAWVLYAWSRRQEAAATVLFQQRPMDQELRFVWYLLRIGTTRALHDSPESLKSLVDELDAEHFGDPNLEANIRIRIARAALRFSDGDNQLVRVLANLESLSPNNQASYWMNVGLQQYHHGHYADAHCSIALALKIYEGLQLNTLADKARQNLSGVLYSSGALPQAAEGVRSVYAASLRRGVWSRCADSLFNVIVIALLRGHLGAARRACRELRGCLPRVGRRESEQDSRYVDALVSLRLGLLPQAEALLNSDWSPDDSLYGKALSVSGEARMLQGELEVGRDLWRRGVTATRERALLDDAAELLVGWLLCEIDVGGRDSALALFDEFTAHDGHCSVPARSLLVLAEAEMAALDWLDTTETEGGVKALLHYARAGLDRCDLGYYAWRTSWRLGQVNARQGNQDMAIRHFYDARDALLRLSRSIESPRLAESFLALPAPTRLIEDLERNSSL